MEIRTVLLVDDDRAIRKITKFALEGVAQWEVTAVESGYAALASLESWQPDVILLDMMMPGMDGATTFEAIKHLPNCSKIPVIFITAKVQSHEIEQYVKIGAAGVITKPYDPIELPNQVSELAQAYVDLQAGTSNGNSNGTSAGNSAGSSSGTSSGASSGASTGPSAGTSAGPSAGTSIGVAADHA